MLPDLWLYRPDRTPVTSIAPIWDSDTGYRYLQLAYDRIENEVSELTLTMPYDASPPLSFFALDSLLGVWNGTSLDTETLWFVRVPPTLRYSERGDLLVEVKAVCALYLLAGRIVAYAAGSSQTSKTGAADDLIKAVVRENLGSLAPADRDLSSAGLTVAADTGQGATVYKTFTRRNVLLVCKELARASAQKGKPIFFDIVRSGTSLELRTYLGARGNDHSSSGIQPVTLSPEFGNLRSVQRVYDHREEVTVVYCGGQGTEDDRLIVSVTDAARLNQSPWNRREMWVDARYLALEDSLATEADGALWRRRPRQSLTGVVTSQPGSAYGIQWGWGDLCLAEVDAQVETVRVHQISVQVANGARQVRATLRADSTDSEDAIRAIAGQLDSDHSAEFPPWSVTPAADTLPLADSNGEIAAGWLPPDVVRQSQFPAMAVRKTAIQSGLAAYKFTKVTWNKADSGSFDTMLSRWTPGVAGSYLFVGSLVLYGAIEDGKRYIVSLFKNGVRHRDYQYLAAGTSAQSAPILFPVVPLTATDYVEIYLYPLTTASATVFGGPTETSWSGVRVA